MSREPSRAVTSVKCATCQRRFTPTRSDARYCSGACRQRAHRARAQLDDLDREIEQTRVRYWQLVREKAEALGAAPSHVVTAQAQFVDTDGNVWMGGATGGMSEGRRLVGHTTPNRPGWSSWGLEAAGPPWSPPSSSDNPKGQVFENAILGRKANRERQRKAHP